MNTNEISIAIKISEFDLDIKEISKILNLMPTHSHYKDDFYNVKTSIGEQKKKYEYNYWEYRLEFKSDDWPQILVNKFINEIVDTRKDILQKISKRSRIEFFIGINYYQEANPSFHFEIQTINLFSYIGFELDIDLYQFTK
jgi:hypothetical protein